MATFIDMVDQLVNYRCAGVSICAHDLSIIIAEIEGSCTDDGGYFWSEGRRVFSND